MIESLTEFRDYYINNFPALVPTKAAQGFIATTAISMFFDNNTKDSLVYGAVAATATLIEAVTRPIIKATFPETPCIEKIIQMSIANIMVNRMTDALNPSIDLPYTYNIAAAATSFCMWLALNRRFFFENDVGMVVV